MNAPRKLWLALLAGLLGLAMLACSLGALLPTPTPTPTTLPLPSATPTSTSTSTPLPLPSATATLSPGQSLAGRWNDPDTTGTVTTIVAQDGGYAVASVINPDRGTNELTRTSWSDGVLIWTYCIPGGNCITSKTVSLDANNLSTTWTDDRGGSGETTFLRLDPEPAAASVNDQSLAGRWNDPDTFGTVTTIIAQDGGYAVASVINPNRGGNELTQTDWSNGVLTWTYCIPNSNCITSKTVSLDGNSLSTTWTDDGGASGETTFERLP